MAVTPGGKNKILRWSRVYYSGYDLSGDARSFSTLENQYGAVELTGWSEAHKNYLSDGRLMVGVNGFNAHVNDTTGRAFDRLKSATNTGHLDFCFGSGAEPTYGDPVYMMSGVALQMSDTTAFDAGAATISADFKYDRSGYDADVVNPIGVTLHGPVSRSASLTASSTTSVDLGANAIAAATGWHAHCHSLVVGGNFNVVRIMDSTDDSAFSSLGTFTLDGNTITSEAINGTGAPDRYVAFEINWLGGASTFICTFALTF